MATKSGLHDVIFERCLLFGYSAMFICRTLDVDHLVGVCCVGLLLDLVIILKMVNAFNRSKLAYYPFIRSYLLILLGLEIRESKQLGIYVDGISKRPVDSSLALLNILQISLYIVIMFFAVNLIIT